MQSPDKILSERKVPHKRAPRSKQVVNFLKSDAQKSQKASLVPLTIIYLRACVHSMSNRPHQASEKANREILTTPLGGHARTQRTYVG